jgi:hypothetical protein
MHAAQYDIAVVHEYMCHDVFEGCLFIVGCRVVALIVIAPSQVLLLSQPPPHWSQARPATRHRVRVATSSQTGTVETYYLISVTGLVPRIYMRLYGWRRTHRRFEHSRN